MLPQDAAFVQYHPISGFDFRDKNLLYRRNDEFDIKQIFP